MSLKLLKSIVEASQYNADKGEEGSYIRDKSREETGETGGEKYRERYEETGTVMGRNVAKDRGLICLCTRLCPSTRTEIADES